MERIVKIEDIEIDIKREAVLRRLGFSPRRSVLTPQVEDVIEGEMNRFKGISNFKALYGIWPVSLYEPETIYINSTGKSFKSSALYRRLEGCIYCSIFATTIGDEPEDAASSLFSEGEQTKAAVLDAIGSVAAEALTEELSHIIAKSGAEEGLVPVTRFSPGYGDLPLDAQNTIFSILNPSTIGIRLTPRLIMYPEKSVTAIMGLKKRR